MRILAVVQARLSSARFPGKVLSQINGKKLIQLLLERLNNSQLIDDIVVATSNEDSDNLLFEYLDSNGINVYRGSLNNVLSRYIDCKNHYNADVVIRITGDCPLVDPVLVDEIVTYHLNNSYDYTSNAIKPTFADGFDIEVINSKVLDDLINCDLASEELEHVTLGIYNRFFNKYQVGNFSSNEDNSHLRVTVDYKEDLQCLQALSDFVDLNLASYKEITKILNLHSELQTFNSHFIRNEALK